MDNFSTYHPVVNFVYFILLFIATLQYKNPIIMAIVFICMFVYLWILEDGRTVFRLLRMGILITVLSFVINPLFNHQGVTVVFYLNQNPITKESFLYAGVVAFFMIGIIFLFSCFQRVMSADKVTVLLGKISPKFALTFSMALNLVPQLAYSYHQIERGLEGIGEKNHVGKAIRNLTGIALEDSIDRSDTMKARGYILTGRKTHVIPRMRAKDWCLLLLLLVVFATMQLIAGRVSLQYEFFPYVIVPEKCILQMIYYFELTCVGLLPVIFEIKEFWIWHRRF